MASNNSVTITLSARDEASKVIQGLRGSLTAATAAGNILANTITSGVSRAFQGLSKSVSEASDIQLNNITGAGTFAALTGKSYGEATKFIDKMNLSLAKTAATLPGTTQGYKDIALGIMDNLLPAFQDANGVVNEEEFLKGITNITTGLGVLGAASNVASSDISKFTGKFMGGASMAELSQLLFAEANPAFLSIMQRKLDESGKKLEQLTVNERKTILEAVQKELVTPEVIAAASNSLGGLLEGLKSSLFEQTTGMFGLLRDLDEETEGEQSAFSAIQRIFVKLFGNNGIFPTIGNIMRDLGIDADPMKMLSSGLGKLGRFLDGLKQLLWLIDDVGLKDLPYELGTKIGEFINKVIDPSKATEHVKKMGELIWKGIKGFTETLGTSLATLDSTSISVIMGGIITGAIVAALIPPLLSGIAALGVAMAGFAVAPVAILGVLGALAVIQIVKNWDEVKAGLTWFFTGLGKVIKGTAEGIFTVISGIITGDWSVMKTGFKQIGDAAKKVIDGVKGIINTILGKLPGAQQANLDEAAKKAEDKYNQAYFNKYGVWPDSAYGLPNAATGMNYGGLLAAASREAKQAPSGSSLVVANSSEAILNKGQQSQLLNSIGNRGGVTIGNITVNSNASDPREVAKEVIRTLNQEFAKYTATTRSVPV